MANFAINDVIEVIARGQSANSDIVTTFHYRAKSLATPDLSLDNVDDSFVTGPFDKVLLALPGVYNLRQLQINVLTGARTGDFRLAEYQRGLHVGQMAGPYLPEQVAISIKRRAGLRGRKYQSRIFLSPVDVSFQDAAGLGTDFVDTTQMKLNNVKSMLSADWTNDIGVWTPCIWHRATSSYDDITSTGIASGFVRRQSRKPREPFV